MQSSKASFVSLPGSHSSLKELWQFRYMVLQLVVRDLTVRYRRTWLGWIWAFLNPASNLIMYYCVFVLLLRVGNSGYDAPWPLVLLCGLTLWLFFSSILNATSDSLINNLHLINKIWFPRSVLTIAATGASLVDFVLLLLCLLFLLPFCSVHVSYDKVPLILICGLLTVLYGWGLGSMLAVLKLKFRDLKHVMPILMQILFYSSPVVWTQSLVNEHAKWMLIVNPLYALICLFRYALLGGTHPTLMVIGISALECIFLALLGYVIFIRYESEISELE